MGRPLISESCSAIHQRLLSSLYEGRKGALVSLHRGAAGGPGMISGGMKPLWGCAAADGPSTTAEHPVSRLQAAHRGSHSVTTITSVSHVHRWLQIGGRPSPAHENHVEPTEMGHSLPPLRLLKTLRGWFCLMQIHLGAKRGIHIPVVSLMFSSLIKEANTCKGWERETQETLRRWLMSLNF